MQQCQNCFGTNMKKLFSVNHCEIEMCSSCGFVEMTHCTKRFEYTEKYFQNSKYDDKKSLKKELRRRRRLLETVIPKGSVLDFGCAAGEFVEYIMDAYEVKGCDVSEEAIRLGIERNQTLSEHIWSGKEETLKGTFQAICMWDVIEHLDKPHNVVQSLCNHLENGGYLLISTPNIGAGFARLTRKKWPFMTPPEHVSFFNKKSMKIFAEKQNLQIIEWKSKGKWVNVGFIFYKLHRVAPAIVSAKMVKRIQRSFLARLNCYVPTKDIQYVTLKKCKK